MRLGYFRLVLAVAAVLLLAPLHDAHSETSETDTTVLFAVEFVSASLDAMEEQLRGGSAGDAAAMSAVAAEVFPLHLEDLRLADRETSDEIHITLLDLHGGMGTAGTQVQLERISSVRGLLENYSYENPDYGLAAALLLTVVDEQYQEAVTSDSQVLHRFAAGSVDRAYAMFSNADFDERLTLEVESFFAELDQMIDDRDGFLQVGTLITAINRDLTGHEAVAYDKQKLYETIRDLYARMLVAVDGGDYDTAEELAIEAYLENFEYLEPDIEEADPELLYALEIDMREVVRDMIRNGQDAGRIKVFVTESILPDLALAESQVQELVGEDGSVTAVREVVLKERGDATDDQQSGVRGEIDFIRSTLQEMLVQYEAGDYDQAYTSARTAYLDSYEFVEIPLRAIDPDFTLEVEFQFAQLRNLIKERAPYDSVQGVVVDIRRNLDESERLVSGTGTLAPAIAFSSSFAIIFREGLEAVLILGTILTYLEASRNNRFKKHVYLGVVAAIGATGLTWLIASFLIGISGASRELIEAIAALSATAMLFYVSFWVLSKIEHKKWMEFVKAKVWQATTTGGVMVFVLLSFFTVYREGFETVLFYQAMSSFAKYMEAYVVLGFVAGLGVLFVLYYVVRRLGKKMPLRALFGLTMGVGAYMSIAFLGNAVRELQILDIVPYTAMFGVIPRLDINIAAMTGIYPTLETVVAQVVLLAVYLIASFYVLIARPRREQKLASMRVSHRDAGDAGEA